MGKRGVLLTCMGGKEMQAGRDAVRILTQVRQASLWQEQPVCVFVAAPLLITVGSPTALLSGFINDLKTS